MAETLKEKLIKKGWTHDEIEKTMNIIHSEEKKLKHIDYKVSMNFIVYWAVLLNLTIANFVVSIVLVPFLLVLKPFFVEMIVALLGVVFGLLFNLIIRDIEHIEMKHHLAAAVFIPAVAIINIFVVVSISNSIAEKIRMPLVQSPIYLSMIYVGAFILPYVITSLKDLLKERAKGV